MAAKSLTAQVHTAIGKIGRVVVLDLGVEKLDPVIQVASVERGIGLPHDLDVLLRHRPRSISRTRRRKAAPADTEGNCGDTTPTGAV
jgi:hypothetical protein